MRDTIVEILHLQSDYSSRNTEPMQRRGQLVRTELRRELEKLIPAMAARSGVDDLHVQGKDGTGLKTEIPWTRIYSASRSQRPTSGWYLVFLFSAAGDRVYLSLMQGTTRWDGAEFRPQPEADLIDRSNWARALLTAGGPFPITWTTDIHLGNTISQLGTGYALGTAVAKEYLLDDIPSDADIEQDLLQAATWLGQIYRAVDEGLYVPGDSPDLADVEDALEEIAEPLKKRKGGGPRLTAAERRAIEERAMLVTMEHFCSPTMGYQVKDVGKTESYDIHATKTGQIVKIEVKGTTSNGSEIVLTRNEVDLHLKDYPTNALAIVRNIKLHRDDVAGPTASGGKLVLEMPWAVEETRLAPIAYRYTTGL